MQRDPHDPLEPELDEAKATLQEALDAACTADVERLDTGEMIRIEEVLAIANDAAKRVVSMKRRIRRDQDASRASQEEQPNG